MSRVGASSTWRPVPRGGHDRSRDHRLVTCTDSVAGPRSKVAAGEMFLANTRTVLLLQVGPDRQGSKGSYSVYRIAGAG